MAYTRTRTYTRIQMTNNIKREEETKKRNKTQRLKECVKPLKHTIYTKEEESSNVHLMRFTVVHLFVRI